MTIMVFISMMMDPQQHPLLGVHHSRLYRGNAEESGVELVNPLDESTAPVSRILSGRVSGDAAPWARILPSIRNRALACFQKTPESRKVGRAGEATCHAHDGYTVLLEPHLRAGFPNGTLPDCDELLILAGLTKLLG